MRLFLICIAMFFAQQANAAVTINIAQSGADVESVMSGSVNTGATLGLTGSASGFNGFSPGLGAVGYTTGLVDYYTLNTKWTPFGAGVFANWTAASGDAFTMFTNGAFDYVAVPGGYSSGALMSATSTSSGTTLAVLGMTPGTFVTTFSAPEGPSDTVTIIVGVNDDAFTPVVSNEIPPSVPEGFGGYVPDGSFAVSITDGASCTGTTYDIAITPIASSSPLGNTPAATVPPTVTGATAAGSPYIFAGGAGSYDVAVTETGICLPLVNPELTTATIPDLPSVDLNISKVVDRDPAIAGDAQPLVYTVTVTNPGPSDAVNVIVLDTLPLGVSNPVTVNCV